MMINSVEIPLSTTPAFTSATRGATLSSSSWAGTTIDSSGWAAPGVVIANRSGETGHLSRNPLSLLRERVPPSSAAGEGLERSEFSIASRQTLTPALSLRRERVCGSPQRPQQPLHTLPPPERLRPLPPRLHPLRPQPLVAHQL